MIDLMYKTPSGKALLYIHEKSDLRYFCENVGITYKSINNGSVMYREIAKIACSSAPEFYKLFLDSSTREVIVILEESMIDHVCELYSSLFSRQVPDNTKEEFCAEMYSIYRDDYANEQ